MLRSLVFTTLLIGATVEAAEYDDALATVGRTLADCLAAKHRQRVAAVDFSDLGARKSELGRLIAEELSTELVMRADRAPFVVLSRTHLQQILDEHQIASSGLVDSSTARKIGEFAGVDTLVTGNIIEQETRIRATIHAIDTATATIVCAARLDLPGSMLLREAAGSRGNARPSGADAPHSVTYRDGLVEVTLRSLVKSSDGSRIELILGIASQLNGRLLLALNATADPLLTDNAGTAWKFVRAAGLDAVPAAEGPYYSQENVPSTHFATGAERPITFVFETEEPRGSAGRVFALSSSLVYMAYRANEYGGHNRDGPGQLSVGLTDLRLR